MFSYNSGQKIVDLVKNFSPNFNVEFDPFSKKKLSKSNIELRGREEKKINLFELEVANIVYTLFILQCFTYVKISFS